MLSNIWDTISTWAVNSWKGLIMWGASAAAGVVAVNHVDPMWLAGAVAALAGVLISGAFRD